MRLTALIASVFALTFGIAAATSAEQQERNQQQPVSETQQTTLVVQSAWSRELPPTAPVGAAFLTVRNHSAETDRLLSAQSSIAEFTELHAHFKQGDMMRMVKVEAIDIPAHAELILQPGGYHIMLINLRKPLVVGESFPLTLYFEHAGPIEITVPIKNSDAGTSASQGEMDHSAHSQH